MRHSRSRTLASMAELAPRDRGGDVDRPPGACRLHRLVPRRGGRHHDPRPRRGCLDGDRADPADAASTSGSWCLPAWARRCSCCWPALPCPWRRTPACAAARRCAEASWTLQKRGWQIFGLALLFRLQAYVFSAGATPLRHPQGRHPERHGPLAGRRRRGSGGAAARRHAAWCWRRSPYGRRARPRAAAARVVVAGAACPTRSSGICGRRPSRSTFTLFPWSAFVFAGLALGEWLAVTSADAREPLPCLVHRGRHGAGPRRRTSSRSCRRSCQARGSGRRHRRSSASGWAS